MRLHAKPAILVTLVSVSAITTGILFGGCSSSSTSAPAGGGDSGTSADSGAAGGDTGTTSADTGTTSADTGAPPSDSGVTGDTGSAGGDGGGTPYGTTCTSNANCSGTYNSCQMIMQKLICTKSCTMASDCPSPPTSGTCNGMGYCK